MLAIASGCQGPGRDAAVPDNTLARAWHFYRLQESDLALQAFEQAAKGADAAEALYGLGLSLAWRAPDNAPEAAKKVLAEALATEPGSPWAPWCRLELARIEHIIPPGGRPDFERVRAAYQEVIDGFPGHPAAHEALIHQQATLLLEGDAEEAQAMIARLTRFLAAYPDSPWATRANELYALACRPLERWEDRLDAYIRALETMEWDPDVVMNFALPYWMIAVMAEFEVGDFETARMYYQKIIDEYPRDQKTYSAVLALERMDAFEADLRAELARGTDGGPAPSPAASGPMTAGGGGPTFKRAGGGGPAREKPKGAELDNLLLLMGAAS